MNIETVNELIQSLESAGELSIREQKFLKLAKAFKQLAAENVAMKAAAEFATAPDMWVEQADGMLDYRYCDWYVDILKAAMETPATDSIVAGIKADGRVEGINFAASRLAAAFNHGFVDKPMAEVGDVVRMILTAKEDLANDLVLAADGLSGEYAEKSLAEWEAELREGAK
ncbi:TPA: hypothetical protein ACTVB1_001487 [Klebsiella pneumoniae]